MAGSGYRFGALIGRGSTGEVWTAESITDGHADGQHFAIKILDHELVDDPAAVARFLQELQILTRLRSPHLVRVHDLVADDGTLAIVMDLVDGSDLRAFVHHYGTLPPALACELVCQILGALSVVHGAGIVHRDLKPENMLIDLSEPYRPKALLSDFGIAMIVGDPSEDGAPEFAGTLPYLAPEVLQYGQASQASDLYGTGVVLYELLAGRTPFEAAEPDDLIRAQLQVMPAPIPGLHPAVQAVLAALLAKSPRQRPVSAIVARQMLAQAAVAAGSAPALPPMASAGGYQGPTVPPSGALPVQSPLPSPVPPPQPSPVPPPQQSRVPPPQESPVAAAAAGGASGNWWVARNAQPVQNTSNAFMFEPPHPVSAQPMPPAQAAGPVTPWSSRPSARQARIEPPAEPAPSWRFEPLTTEFTLDDDQHDPDTDHTATGYGPGLDAAGYAARHGQPPPDHPSPSTNALFGGPRAYYESYPGDVVPASREAAAPSRRWWLIAAVIVVAVLAVAAALFVLLGRNGSTQRPANGAAAAAIPQAQVAVDGVPVGAVPIDVAASTAASATPSTSRSPAPAASAKGPAKAVVPATARSALIVMPRLTGRSLDAADAVLGRRGLAQATATRGCYGSGPANRVITQKPAAGSTVKPSATVSVTVQDDCAKVPDVIGRTRDQAVKALRAAGFTTIHQTGGRGSADASSLQVVGQFPAAGLSVPKNGIVVVQLQNSGSGGGGKGGG